MQKIGNITNTADPQGEFTDGSVAQGISPTILLAAIFNTWQREMVGVVEGAGIALDSADDGQLLAAIKSLNKKSNEGFLLKGNNLSEIKLAGSIAQALTRGNIGLGTAAVANVGTGANQVPDMNSFASGTGWFKLPSGLIIQSGGISGSTSGSPTANFPVPFTTTVLGIFVGCQNITSPVFTAGQAISVSSFRYNFRTASAYTNDSGYYIAVGI